MSCARPVRRRCRRACRRPRPGLRVTPLGHQHPVAAIPVGHPQAVELHRRPRVDRARAAGRPAARDQPAVPRRGRGHLPRSRVVTDVVVMAGASSMRCSAVAGGCRDRAAARLVVERYVGERHPLPARARSGARLRVRGAHRPGAETPVIRGFLRRCRTRRRPASGRARRRGASRSAGSVRLAVDDPPLPAPCLVVDDDATLPSVPSRVLAEAAGLRSSGRPGRRREALAAATSCSRTAVLVDVGLPDGDGIALAEARGAAMAARAWC